MPSRLAVISFLDEAGSPPYPSNGLPGGGGYVDNSLPGGSGGRPDNSLPPGAVQLPVFPFDPTVPDNSLPKPPGHASTQPIVPGGKFVVKWLACKGLILVPDNELPPTPEPK